MNLKGYNGNRPQKLEKTDELMLTKINYLIENVKKLYLEYNIAEGKRQVENFSGKYSAIIILRL